MLLAAYFHLQLRRNSPYIPSDFSDESRRPELTYQPSKFQKIRHSKEGTIPAYDDKHGALVLAFATLAAFTTFSINKPVTLQLLWQEYSQSQPGWLFLQPLLFRSRNPADTNHGSRSSALANRGPMRIAPKSRRSVVRIR